jgi:hypothetical protein
LHRYGDYGPDNHTGKIFAIFYILVSISIVTFALTRFATAKIERRLQLKEQEMLNKKLDFNLIRELDVDGNGIDKIEFLVGILTQIGIIDKERHVDPWLERFDELDKDGNGTLDANDIAMLEASIRAELSEIENMDVSGEGDNDEEGLAADEMFSKPKTNLDVIHETSSGEWGLGESSDAVQVVAADGKEVSIDDGK